MEFNQIKARVRGLGVPVFGDPYQPSKADVAHARALVAFLEDRRVLFNDYEMECPDHCVQSVLQIRAWLTDLVGKASSKSGLGPHLRAILAACREFLDHTGVSSHHLWTFS